MRRYLNLLIIAISMATIASGLAQVVAPSFVLHFVGADITTTATQLFATIGIFLVLCGGLMLHAVYSAYPSVAILWCAFQKIGACIAVLIGIANGVFSIMAIGIALFDLLSGILFLYYLKTLHASEAA
jgi:hypothetical protein